MNNDDFMMSLYEQVSKEGMSMLIGGTTADPLDEINHGVNCTAVDNGAICDVTNQGSMCTIVNNAGNCSSTTGYKKLSQCHMCLSGLTLMEKP